MASIFTSGVFEGFDSNGDPLAGGKLYTYAAGTTTPLASYTNQGGGTPNANPVILDSAGRANVWLGTSAYRLLLKTSADVTVWDTDNVRSSGFDSAADLALLAASTGSSLVGHIATGTGAVATTVQAKLRKRVDASDFNVVGSGDETTKIQAAINYAASIGAELQFGDGTFTGNWTLPQEIRIRGNGRNKTIFKPQINAPVFTTDTTVSTVRIYLASFDIVGDVSMTLQDGIHLKSTDVGEFVNTVHLYDLGIGPCGRHGIYTYGVDSSAPFIQELYIEFVTIGACVQEGLYMDGAAFECVFVSFWVTNCGSNVIPNCSLGSRTRIGSGPNRITWIGGGANQTTVAANARHITDLVTTAGNAAVTSASNPFVAGDTGKYIAIHNGGLNGNPHIATMTYVSAGQVNLSAVVPTSNAGGTNAILNMGIGGAVSISSGKQIKFIGVDFENANVFIVVRDVLNQNISVDNCNFGSSKPVLATFWLQGGGLGFEASNYNTSNSISAHFYNLLVAYADGTVIGLTSQMMQLAVRPSANPPLLAHEVRFDYQNRATDMILYNPDSGHLRINGTGAVNKILDYAGGTTALRMGQQVILYGNGGCTINHTTTASGNIWNPATADRALANGGVMLLVWDDVTNLWFSM